MSENQDLQDVVIIGSGPAGYTAAIYAARAGFAPKVVAGQLTAGGALMNTTDVENFPGFPEGVMGPDLMENLQQQAEKFGAEVLWEDAVGLELSGDVKKVTLADGSEILSKTIILATGSAYRELGLPAEKQLSGRGVSWCATCDGFFFKEQNVVVVGGGDSAMEEATFLTRFATKVTVVDPGLFVLNIIQDTFVETQRDAKNACFVIGSYMRAEGCLRKTKAAAYID